MCVSPSLGYTDKALLQSCLQYCVISQLILTCFSKTWHESMCPFTSCFMNYSTGNLMVNTAHKIRRLCECIGQGSLHTPPPIHLFPLGSLHSLPALSPSIPLDAHHSLPVFTISPPPPHSSYFLSGLYAVLIALFIKEYKYFPPVCCISGCLFFFLCQLSGGLSLSSALILTACLLLLYRQYFSLINHWHYSWP